MKEYFFLLSSVTSAMKSEGILQKNGYKAYVFRDTGMNPYGCGYVVKAAGDKDNMADLLRKNGIRINEIRDGR